MRTLRICKRSFCEPSTAAQAPSADLLAKSLRSHYLATTLRGVASFTAEGRSSTNSARRRRGLRGSIELGETFGVGIRTGLGGTAVVIGLPTA